MELPTVSKGTETFLARDENYKTPNKENISFKNKEVTMSDLDKKQNSTSRKEQAILRSLIVGNSTKMMCSMCSKVYPTELIVTAHIKKRAECNEEEKKDVNVVFPLCKVGCDELFESGDIVVNEQGEYQANKSLINNESIKALVQSRHGKKCYVFNEKTKPYFKWHRENHNHV